MHATTVIPVDHRSPVLTPKGQAWATVIRLAPLLDQLEPADRVAIAEELLCQAEELTTDNPT